MNTEQITENPLSPEDIQVKVQEALDAVDHTSPLPAPQPVVNYVQEIRSPYCDKNMLTGYILGITSLIALGVIGYLGYKYT
jgi:hypothetical protein